ncbi:MAG: hypothetical protein ACTTJV_09600 [Ottowia sp.]
MDNFLLGSAFEQFAADRGKRWRAMESLTLWGAGPCACGFSVRDLDFFGSTNDFLTIFY